MTALNEIQKAGLVISLADGFIKVSNPSKLTNELKTIIQDNKAEIIAQLLRQNITRQIEDSVSTTAIRVYCYRTTEKPSAELVAIMPGTELVEAREKLKNKYGDRLLDVYHSPYCFTGIPANTTKH
ncbi:hypothetical protein [Methylobacter sp.]|uniref:hypothetical protein n=1 Tax=Methylobacter sp. TaxID=2051955 RepID=UPI0024876B26|nr:hypothetical protein [Methylobacter sp.]MDI1278804.1 hypothetical protein [Methylobacter sp.]MDI1358515.1 hypothetical protein [Methylobacter sp.]